MRHFTSLQGWSLDRLAELFELVDAYAEGRGHRHDGAAAAFFPPSSIRTRATFERGLAQMGLQPIVFPPESLDKAEALGDVAGYLAQWCDVLVVRHPDPAVVEGLAAAGVIPVVNAMTDADHPCEVTTDLYALSRTGRRIDELRYVFVGAAGNIGLAWASAARELGLDLVQSCPPPLAMPGVRQEPELAAAVRRADVIVTDPPGPHAEAMAAYRITAAHLDEAPEGCLLDPCPPFVRGREMDADVIDDGRWVGHGFKRALLPVQQAIVSWCLSG